ncbi:MAG: GTP-binding protein [Candidatus Thorarchaeota archaeon]
MSPRILLEIEDELNTSAIAVGDITGNGLAEICTGGRDGVIRIYDGNQAEITLLAQHNVSGAILSIKIADANNDGQMELVVGRSLGSGESAGTAGTMLVFKYSLSGMLELLAAMPVDRFVTTVVVTDVTGDNKNEILVGASDKTLRVIQMSTDNTLSEYTRRTLEDMPICIGTCDVIGDEVDEIVTGNRDKTLRIFKIRDHSLDEMEVLELPSPIISLASGDILGDRKMELAVVTYDGSVRVYRNEESKIELFSTLENIKALSVRIEELNADHMDEVVIATSDNKIKFYNLYMAELNPIATVDIGSKILSISIGDAGGDDRKEILVGVSDAPLKVIEGLYQIIPKFQVSTTSKSGTQLTGSLTVMNVTDQPLDGITGKIYWFPKNNMDVAPQQLRFDMGPGETKTIDVKLTPHEEGTVIVRPIVLMWTDASGQVRQVTTPEVAILVESGVVEAAPASSSPVIMAEASTESSTTEAASPFAPVVGTGFAGTKTEPVVEPPPTNTPVISTSSSTPESLKAAEDLLDKLFGETTDGSDAPALAVKKVIADDPAPAAVVEPVTVTTPIADATHETISADESSIIDQIRARAPKPQKPGSGADTYSFLFKTMIIGEGAVGKTALVNRFTTGAFEQDYKTTIGSQFAVKLTYISPEESEYAVGIKLQAWDVAGQARFKAVRKMYYSGASGVVLVFDVTRRRSFAELVKWVEEADASIGTRVPFICIGNKIDLPDRAVPSEEAKKWAEGNGFVYMESSAKTGAGVADMFTVLAELMWREARAVTEAKKGGM